MLVIEMEGYLVAVQRQSTFIDQASFVTVPLLSQTSIYVHAASLFHSPAQGTFYSTRKHFSILSFTYYFLLLIETHLTILQCILNVCPLTTIFEKY